MRFIGPNYIRKIMDVSFIWQGYDNDWVFLHICKCTI